MLTIIELSFLKKADRNICADREAAQTKFGAALGDALISRLADIRASTSVAELGHVAPVTLHDDGVVAIGVGDIASLMVVCTALHVACPRFAGGTIDWTSVARLQIIELEVAQK